MQCRCVTVWDSSHTICTLPSVLYMPCIYSIFKSKNSSLTVLHCQAGLHSYMIILKTQFLLHRKNAMYRLPS